MMICKALSQLLLTELWKRLRWNPQRLPSLRSLLLHLWYTACSKALEQIQAASPPKTSSAMVLWRHQFADCAEASATTAPACNVFSPIWRPHKKTNAFLEIH